MEEMTESELKAASWLHKRRDLLKRIGYGVFIGIDAIIVFILIFTVGKFIIEYRVTQNAYTTMGDVLIIYTSVDTPQALQIIEQGVVPHVTGKYDSYAVVQSNNEKFVGRFNYTFSYAGQTIELDDGYILPNTTQTLVVAGFKNTSGGGTLTAQLGDTKWERLKGVRPEVNFVISNQEFKRVSVPTRTSNANTNTGDLTGASEELSGNTNTNANANANENSNATLPTNSNENDNENSNNNTNEFFRPEDADTTESTPDISDYTTLTAELFNDSAYGFRTVHVLVVLKNSQGLVVGVAKRVLRDVQSLSTSSIDITWQKPFAIDVAPEIMVTTDYFSEENLILPGEE